MYENTIASLLLLDLQTNQPETNIIHTYTHPLSLSFFHIHSLSFFEITMYGLQRKHAANLLEIATGFLYTTTDKEQRRHGGWNGVLPIDWWVWFFVLFVVIVTCGSRRSATWWQYAKHCDALNSTSPVPAILRDCDANKTDESRRK